MDPKTDAVLPLAISVCLIVCNEEATLARCLASVRELAAEIIVVDTGSTDRTREIASSFGAVCHAFTWTEDFSAARNHALSLASQPWTMMLDGDDWLPEPSAQVFIAEFLRTSEPRVIQGTRHFRNQNQQSTYTLAWPTTAGFRYHGRVHEVVKSDTAIMAVKPQRLMVPSERPEWGPEDVSLRQQTYARLMARAVVEGEATCAILIGFGDILASQGEVALAETQFEAARNHPDCTTVEWTKATYLLATTLLGAGQAARADAYLEELCGRHPDLLDGHVAGAETCLSLGDWRRSMDHWAHAFRLHRRRHPQPFHNTAWHPAFVLWGMSRSLMAGGDTVGAAACTASMTDSVDSHLIGELYRRLKKATVSDAWQWYGWLFSGNPETGRDVAGTDVESYLAEAELLAFVQRHGHPEADPTVPLRYAVQVLPPDPRITAYLSKLLPARANAVTPPA